ncbi:CUE domain-containing protein 1a isoform X1 [Pimephales promelas]|uniref:CUE domain-containing protein 1a isoform X1 n=1 Tax=Pimephales promelas TaxID=90988 RepID=UPI001955AC45|nr:CUE domain-containing protein 1a isoform X1 [Pimephales promelas]XP_039531651.1 CUE domain-containing protein 1a isoform X1 [Pimephales promelas]XP_039531652.1 CUE domain-containing protein 1a isoform X1 [Pimephales promelas]
MMTSLFRRSNANRNHGSGTRGGDAASGELNNRRPPRQVRRLEFSQAMDDFKTMFPSMEHEVIECVLRANQGAVDSTIDQLLQMSLDSQATDDSSDSEDSIPPEILGRTLEPDSSDEEPPPVYAPPSYDMHIYDRKHPADVPSTPPPRFDDYPPRNQQVGRYRNWNPPLLGNLPDDFLRILPQQSETIQRSQSSLSQPSSSSSSSLSSLTQLSSSSALSGSVWSCEQDRKLKQYLDDERIALFLQNQEFMKELQRNRDFLIALEIDRQRCEKTQCGHSSACTENSTEGDNCGSGSEEACSSVSDDALFLEKLKHMGKSTRKKLFEIARSFSEKTRRKKSKKRALPKHQSYPHTSSPDSRCVKLASILGSANSTINLLDEIEAPLLAEDNNQLKRLSGREEREESKEVMS